MDKRNFLKLFTLGLLGSLANACQERSNSAISESKTTAKTKKEVLIIGAGLAGLAAAHILQQQDKEVMVLEARQRIGGRIWTSTQWSDLPLDLGATWIHGAKGNPLTNVAAQINAKRFTTSYQSRVTYNTLGKVLSEIEESQMDELRQKISQVLRKAQNIDPDISIRQAVEPLFQVSEPASKNTQLINFILNSEIEQEYAGSITSLSTHWYDSSKKFKGDDDLFAAGFKIIPEFLAQGLSVTLGEVVQEIHWQETPPKVITAKTEFLADHIIVTLPLGVLQSGKVRFIPELPEDKRNAIAKLGMGVLNKCYLRFENDFWNNVDWLEYVPSRHGEWSQWVNFKRTGHLPILLGLNAADYGREIEAWSDRQIVTSAMQTLRTIYGTQIPDPTDYQITRWGSDPFALGSYSYNRLGSLPTMRQDLAKPLRNTLFFAGEATSQDHFGSTHGAYLSGLRVAEEILAI